MTQKIIAEAIQGFSTVLELLLVLLLFHSQRWRRWAGVFIYVLLYLGLDGIARPWAFAHFGQQSIEYYVTYWASDLVLTLSTFLLLCYLFRRAFRQDQRVWPYLRISLPGLLVLVLLVSSRVVLDHYHNNSLFNNFIWQFQQNLYFTCAVLVTLLYLMLQRQAADEEGEGMGLLACGLGIQCAGPAAGSALITLAGGVHSQFAVSLFEHLSPLCGLTMLLIWAYTINHLSGEAPNRILKHRAHVPPLADLCPGVSK